MKKKFGLAGLVVLMVMLALGAAAEEGNTIIIGCDMYAPYTYKNGTGEFVGVDVDFATEAFGGLCGAVPGDRLGKQAELSGQRRSRLSVELLHDERPRG